MLVRLHEEFVRALKQPEYAAEVRKFYFVPVGNSLEEAAKQQADAVRLIEKAVKVAGITPE